MVFTETTRQRKQYITPPAWEFRSVGKTWLKRFNNVPLKFRKAGRVWCGGARETHIATCHNGVTPSKSKEFLESPRFFGYLWFNICRIKFFAFTLLFRIFISSLNLVNWWIYKEKSDFQKIHFQTLKITSKTQIDKRRSGRLGGWNLRFCVDLGSVGWIGN